MNIDHPRLYNAYVPHSFPQFSHVRRYQESNHRRGARLDRHAPSATNAQHPLNIGSGSGATQFLTGNIAEVIIYDRAITHEERAILVGYLMEKWPL